MHGDGNNGVYYFLGNIPSHILHALPLYKKLGGTFVVLSHKARRELEKYNVPVIVLNNYPYRLKRFGVKLKPVSNYLSIDDRFKKTTDFLEANAKVVIFYELYDFQPSVRLSRPKTIFLTHGNMIKNYMAQNNRLKILEQYDYMAAIGPVLKRQLIERDGVDAVKLVDLGIARTDEIVQNRGRIVIHPELPVTGTLPVISYTPTFWGASSIYGTGLEIVRNFPDSLTLLFRPHPQTPHKVLKNYLSVIKTKPNILYVPDGQYKDVGLKEIIDASSVIIGDVSSVMLEAILSNKPLVFAYDADPKAAALQKGDYASIRGIVDYSEHLDIDNAKYVEGIIENAIKKGVDQRLWKTTSEQLFFHSDGTSTAAIETFVQSLL